MTDIRKVGITGAEGRIGGILRAGLGNDYELTSFTLGPAPFPSICCDLSEEDQIKGKFEGLHAVIHLAADPDPRAPWSSLRKNNIEATYQVFEECRRSGVRRLIFATTNHTQHGNTILDLPESLDLSKVRLMTTDEPPNPDSLYGVSKLFGENMGKYYSERHGLEFVGFRIGWIVPEDKFSARIGALGEDFFRAIYLSHRDCAGFFRRALEIETRYLIAYATSNNDRNIFDLTQTIQVLGYHPQDNAEKFFQS